MRISLRPIGDIPPDVLRDLAEDLEFLGTAEILPQIETDPSWLDPARGRYPAEPFLDAIAGDPGHRVLGVTDADLYAEPYSFVFGQARRYDRPAVLSLAQLAAPDPRRFRERIAKEAIHELGHTLGLDHCENRECVMAFSNSVREVDGKSSAFCRRCQATVDFTGKRLRT